MFAQPSRIERRDSITAVAIGAAWTVVLLSSMRDVGFVRDEGYYFVASRQAADWVANLWRDTFAGHPSSSLTAEAIARHFAYNAEHPGLPKIIYGLSAALLHDKLHLLHESTAFRLPAALSAGVMLALTYLFGTEAHGRRVGLFAAAALALIPRLFHDSHLACFDVPITMMYVAVAYAYWRSLGEPASAGPFLRSQRFRRSVVAAVAFGLALGTKHNAFFLPVFFFAHWLIAHVDEFVFVKRAGEAARVELPRLPVSLIVMVLLGPLVMVMSWPMLWHDTGRNFDAYVSFHLGHVHYPVEYFGAVLDRPPFPWSFPFVMTWLTVPLPTVVLMTLGWIRTAAAEVTVLWRKRRGEELTDQDPRRTRLLEVLLAFLPIGLIALPDVPIFGGVKHWFTAMPFLCLLAAVEFFRLTDSLVTWRRRAALVPSMAAALLLPGVLGIRLVHPYGIAFYNELIGGVRGAARQGMFRSFWGYTSRGNLPYLNAHLDPSGRVFFQRTNPECFQQYWREGLVRSDMQYADKIGDAGWATIHVQRTFDDDEYRIWNDWGTRMPVAGVYLDGVPLNLVYRRPPPPPASAPPGGNPEPRHAPP